MEVMKKNNVIFDFKSEGILDLNTTTGKLQAQILGMVAEMERDNIADAVYMGMAAAARTGRYLGGTPPYGYDISYNSDNKRSSRKLVINKDEYRNNKIDGTEIDKSNIQKQLERAKRDISNLQQRFESDDCDMDVQEYKRRIKELRSHEETYKTRLSKLQVEIRQYQAEKSYTIEELRVVFKNIKDILVRADVVELRTLLHLMIDSITINPATRKPADITIKFNPVLTNYLGIDLEEEAKNASSFLYANKKELVFTISL